MLHSICGKKFSAFLIPLSICTKSFFCNLFYGLLNSGVNCWPELQLACLCASLRGLVCFPCPCFHVPSPHMKPSSAEPLHQAGSLCFPASLQQLHSIPQPPEKHRGPLPLFCSPGVFEEVFSLSKLQTPPWTPSITQTCDACSGYDLGRSIKCSCVTQGLGHANLRGCS